MPQHPAPTLSLTDPDGQLLHLTWSRTGRLLMTVARAGDFATATQTSLGTAEISELTQF